MEWKFGQLKPVVDLPYTEWFGVTQLHQREVLKMIRQSYGYRFMHRMAARFYRRYSCGWYSKPVVAFSALIVLLCFFLPWVNCFGLQAGGWEIPGAFCTINFRGTIGISLSEQTP